RNISALRRLSRSIPITAGSRRGSARSNACRTAAWSALPSAARRFRSSTRRAAVRCARRCSTEASMAEVSLLNATKRYGDVAAIDNVTLTIADGEFVVLLGPTGAGKTTTLRMIAGLEPLDAGSVRIGG